MFGTIDVGEALRHQSLGIFPLRRPAAANGCRLAHEALATGDLVVEELEPEGVLSRLRARNRSTDTVCFLEGQELIGGKQDRALNVSLCLEGGASAVLPVSCIEQGRWSGTDLTLGSHGRIVSLGVRYAIKLSTTRSLAARWGCRAEQVFVWDRVEQCQAALAVVSPTQAWGDALACRRDELRAAVERLPCAEDVCGMAVALGGRVAAVDLFASHQTCREAWPALITAAMLDALVHACDNEPAAADDVRCFLDRMAAMNWWEATIVGAGRHYRAGNGGTLQAARLELDGGLLHLSAIDGEVV